MAVRKQGRKWLVTSRGGKVIGTYATKKAAEAKQKNVSEAKAKAVKNQQTKPKNKK